MEAEEEPEREFVAEAQAVIVLDCDRLGELLWKSEMVLDPVGKALGVVEGEEDTDRVLDRDAKVIVLTCDALVELLWDTE